MIKYQYTIYIKNLVIILVKWYRSSLQDIFTNTCCILLYAKFLAPQLNINELTETNARLWVKHETIALEEQLREHSLHCLATRLTGHNNNPMSDKANDYE